VPIFAAFKILKNIQINPEVVESDSKISQVKKRFLTSCVSRIMAFIVKNIDTKILFACLVGSSTVEIKKIRHKH